MRFASLYRRGLPAVLIAILLTLTSLGFAQDPPVLPSEKTAVVFGQNVHYYEAGTGPVVILLHGLGGSAENWISNISPLSAKWHVYALDQIGFGHSDKPLMDYKIATFVDFLHQFMREQKIPKATLIGNSLGGWIALDFAAQHPEMVDKLVLVDAAGVHLPKPLTVDLNPSSLGAMRKVLEAIFYNKPMVTEELVQHAFMTHLRANDGYTIQRVLAGIFSQDQFEDAKLGALHASTLVVWGREDELTPLAMGEALQSGIPGAKLVVLEQCGHVPQMEKPAEFNQAVLEFLAKP